MSKQAKVAASAKRAGAERKSATKTLGRGAQPYDERTLGILRSMVPGVEIVHPLGVKGETDQDRLARARAMAGHHKRSYGAVILAETMTTRYFQELVLGSAHEIHVMFSKTSHVGVPEKNPYGTIVVVYKPGHRDRIENGLCPIYWEKLH